MIPHFLGGAAFDRGPRERTLGPVVSEGPYVLAVDIGSSSVRGAVLDRRGEPVPETRHRVAQSVRYTSDGAGELDPEELFDHVVAVIDVVVAATRNAGITINAVASDSMWHAVCGVDHDGDSTTPVLTWADRRAAAVLPLLRRRVDDLVQHQRTGARLHWVYPAATILWLAETQPEVFAATRHFLSPGELVYLRLFGETACSVSMASATGLFDQHALAWDPELMAAAGIDERRLSRVSDAPLQGLSALWARRWPELAGIPWFPTVGDGATSSIGAGCIDDSRLALMVGTTGALRLVTTREHVAIPEELWSYRVDATHRILGGALNDGGNLVAWMRSALQLPGDAELEALLTEREPGAHGLTMLPMFAGERGPGWSDGVTGVIAGLTHATRPVDLMHATLEAIALRFSLLARAITAAVPGDRTVVATGAAMRFAPWRQIMADALGLNVTASAVAEASTRGTALLALQHMGAIASLSEHVAPVGVTVGPRPGRHERYTQLLADQTQLYDAHAGMTLLHGLGVAGRPPSD